MRLSSSAIFPTPPRILLCGPRLTVVVCALFIAALTTFAKTSQKRFIAIDARHGLSQSSVLAMVQDGDGYMWVATQDGLNRFDGYRFDVFKPSDDPSSISDNYIRCLLLDRNHRLWIGTRTQGLNRYVPETERFVRFQFDPDNPSGLTGKGIATLMQDRNGLIWIGTEGQGLSRFDPDLEGRFEVLASAPGEAFHQASVRKIYEDQRGNIWIAADASGLWLLKGHLDSKTNDPPLLQFGAIGVVYDMLEDPLGNLWIAAQRGFFRLSPGEMALTPHPAPQSELGDLPIKTLIMDRAGTIWGGTQGEGVLSFPYDEPQRLSRHVALATQQRGLTDNWIHSFALDRMGGFWVGTGEGISYFDQDSTRFAIYAHQGEDSLSHDLVQCVTEDEQGNLWVGTRGGGLNRMDLDQPGVFEHFTSDNKNEHALKTNHIRVIRTDKRGFLWVGTHGMGLARMKLDEPGRFLTFPTNQEQTGALNHEVVRTLHLDQHQTLWVGTQGGGLNLLSAGDAEKGRADFSYIMAEHGLSHDIVRAFYEEPSREGHYWVGTGAGLDRLVVTGDLSDGYHLGDVAFTHYGGEHGLSHNMVIAICPGVSQQLWLGTPNGLNRFDPKTAQVRVFKEGLPNNVIYAIERDESNYLWLSTNKGLSRFDPWAHTFKNYDISDGLPGDEFNAGASARSAKDGRLYFGGMAGLTGFYGNQIRANTYPPHVVLTDLLLFNRRIVPAEPLRWEGSEKTRPSPLEQTLNTTSRVEVRYDDMITIKFAGIHFASPAKNTYAYKLDGLNEEWIYTDASNRTATYTNLASGNYVFRVKAGNKDRVWSEEERTLQLYVKPPLWASYPAYALYGLLFLLLVRLVYRLQSKALHQERSLVDSLKQVDKLKDEFLANTSHELRTPLNGMIGLAESLLERNKNGGDELRMSLQMIVSSGRRLTTLVNDILDFSKLRDRNLELDLRPLDLHALVDVVLTLTRPLVADKDLTLVNAVRTDLGCVEADENRLIQILHNLVGNAVKFTPSGKVTVRAEHRDGRMLVKIRDTGIGIEKDQIERIFNPFVQAEGDTARRFGGTGLGLAITRDLVASHGGTLQVESVPGEGSTFFFDLPPAPGDWQETQEVRAAVASVIALDTAHPSATPLPSAPPEKTLETTGGISPFASGWHILVVDDEAVNRLVLANHLNQDNFRLTEATNGAEALTILTEDPSVDLVLLDIMMPRLSGYEVCRHVRRQHSAAHLPIIFLSARNQVKDLAAGFQAGGNDYISKPFAREELMVRLSHHLALLEANRRLEANRSELETMNKSLVETRQQLVINEKMVSLGTLTAGVSHEINNPASYAHGSMQNLEVDLKQFRDFLFEVAGDDADPDIMAAFQSRLDPLFKHVRLASEGTSRIRSIVMDLNNFARCERGAKERVALTENLRSTLNLVRSNFKESVNFVYNFEDALTLSCRPAEMNQVFMNLVVNACQAIQDRYGKHPETPGELVITTRREGKEGVISFRDNGGGVSEAHRDKIFDPFYTTKPRGHGTGQGLAITKGIIDAHQGRIELTSEEGAGSTFTIFLPIDSDAETSPQAGTNNLNEDEPTN